MSQVGRSWSLRLGAAGAVLVLLLLGAATARAGTYAVHACGPEADFATNSWRASASRGMLAYSKCPTRGDPIRGIVVRNEAGEGEVRRGARALMRFKAPAGAQLAELEYDWDGRRVDGEWSIGLARGDGSRWLSGCRAGRPSMRADCTLGRPGAGSERLSLSGLDSVRLEASCGRSGGCETRPTGNRRTGRSRARLRLADATMRVEDATRPRLSVSGDLLVPGRWLRGTQSLEVGAVDNVGIRATGFSIDGVRRVKRRPCDYTRPAPCGSVPSRARPIDTTRLRDGGHLLSVDAVDAADNRSVVRRAIRIDNHAPERIRDLRVDGGQGVRATNSFDVRWSVPPGQAAPIARAHYRLCRVGKASSGARACQTGTRAGGAPAITGLSVPGRGDYALRVWLEDAAGNVDPRAASNRVRLRFDDRLETRLRGGIVDDEGGVSRRRTVPYGTRALTRGTVTSATGQGLRGARVDVLSRTRGSDGGYRRVATAVADGSGRFEHLAARGPSRSLRFVYGGSETHQPSSDDARLGVRASSTIRVSDRRARNGDRVRFSGRLRGRPLPPGGKLVELQARYRKRWRAFEVVRTGDRGEWSHRYRFGGTRGVVTYPFRAAIRREADYPYELGYSDVVKVRVDGR